MFRINFLCSCIYLKHLRFDPLYHGFNIFVWFHYCYYCYYYVIISLSLILLSSSSSSSSLLFCWSCCCTQRCWTYKGLTSLNLSIFIVNNFFYVINCLIINRVMIYRAKCLGIVTSKVLLATCYRYNSEEISAEFLIAKMNLNRIDMSFPVRVL